MRKECYFECSINGRLYCFPKKEEWFQAWKAVLHPLAHEFTKEYITRYFRLCYRHFEDRYILPSQRLTTNAVPTLNLIQYGGDGNPNISMDTNLRKNDLIAEISQHEEKIKVEVTDDEEYEGISGYGENIPNDINRMIERVPQIKEGRQEIEIKVLNDKEISTWIQENANITNSYPKEVMAIIDETRKISSDGVVPKTSSESLKIEASKGLNYLNDRLKIMSSKLIETKTKKDYAKRISSDTVVHKTASKSLKGRKKESQRLKVDRSKILDSLKEVLKWCNATPIGRHGYTGYVCSYCEDKFLDPVHLKKHTLETHSVDEVSSFSKFYDMSRFHVKMDITELHCRICLENFNTLDQIMQHLNDEHEKNISSNINMYMVSFKFNGDVLQCFICNSKFNKFKMIVEHMNVHCRNFVCEICDSGFVTRKRLENHSKCHENRQENGNITNSYPKEVMAIKDEARKISSDGVVPKTTSESLKNEASKELNYLNDPFKIMSSKLIETTTKKDYAKRISSDAVVHKTASKSLKKRKKESQTLKVDRSKILESLKEVLKWSNATPIGRHGDTGYECSYCEDKFSDPAHLKKHTLETHSVDEVSIFSKYNMSRFHIKMDITDLHCRICLENFNTLDQIMQHLNDEHEKNISSNINMYVVSFKFSGDFLQCFICHSKFDKFRLIFEHMNVHCRNFVCEICDAGFLTRAGLKNHSKCHENRIFKCDICDKVFNTLQKKKAHIRYVHTGEVFNKCGYCNQRFKDYRQKLRHIFDVHKITPGPCNIKCQACDREFRSRLAYTDHIRRYHLMEKKYMCTQCDKKFYSLSQLKLHSLNYTTDRPFQCDVCLKSFKKKGTLSLHKKIHANDRRFKCEHCSMAFVQKITLSIHIRNKHRNHI